MTYQDPDPLRDRDLDRNVAIDRDYGSNAMWGWIAGAVVLVLMLVFLFGGSNETNDLTGSHHVAFAHVELREVGQHREKTQSVIDDDGVAAEIQLPSRDDATRVGGLDRCAAAAEKVGTAMRAARFPVEHTSGAEAAVGLAWNRPDEP